MPIIVCQGYTEIRICQVEIRIKRCAAQIGLPAPGTLSHHLCEHKPAYNKQFRGTYFLSGLSHKISIAMPHISLAEVFHARSMSPKTGDFGQAVTQWSGLFSTLWEILTAPHPLMSHDGLPGAVNHWTHVKLYAYVLNLLFESETECPDLYTHSVSLGCRFFSRWSTLSHSLQLRHIQFILMGT